MAVSFFDVAPQQTTDAQFRLWVSSLINALVAVGMTRVAITGQIDETTVLKPAAVNTSQGFAVFRFNDALQATTPFYFKIEFGSGAAATTPSLWITTGTAVDAAGVILGGASTRSQLSIGGSSATAFRSYVCGATNRIAFALWPLFSNTTEGNCIVFNAERTHNADGTDTDACVMVFHAGSSASTLSQHLHTKLGGFAPISGEVATKGWTTARTTATTGGNVNTLGVFPLLYQLGAHLRPPMNLLVQYVNDFPLGAEQVLAIYGANRNYLCGVRPYYPFNASVSNLAFLMRYE